VSRVSRDLNCDEYDDGAQQVAGLKQREASRSLKFLPFLWLVVKRYYLTTALLLWRNNVATANCGCVNENDVVVMNAEPESGYWIQTLRPEEMRDLTR
jgi:hypothetical protein